MSTLMENYTESYRDQVEADLAVERNKRELLERYSNPWRILAYYMVRERVCTIYIEDTSQNVAVEFVVPNDQVKHWHEHALAHPDAQMPRITNHRGA